MNPFSSWLGTFNFLVLQWFFVRLQFTICNETQEMLDWAIIGPVVPLTGWWSDYVWLWGGP